MQVHSGGAEHPRYVAAREEHGKLPRNTRQSAASAPPKPDGGTLRRQACKPHVCCSPNGPKVPVPPPVHSSALATQFAGAWDNRRLWV